MPLPSRLRQLVSTAQFWSDYLGDEVFGEQVAGLPANPYLKIPISPQYSLHIGYFWQASKDENFIEATNLCLRQTDSGRSIVLGWRQDDGHVHPHALRWEEADLIGRLQALRDPELPHPAIPFLLLLPYIAPIEGSDHLLGLRLLNAALRSLGVFNERQIRYRLSIFNLGPAVSEWQRVQPYGWVCHDSDKYSLRDGARMIFSLRQVPKWPANEWPRFPFDEWNDCMRQAERAVAESPQTLIENTGTEPLPPLSEHVELRYQVTDSEAAYSTLPVLCRALFQDGLGVCYLTGGWYPDNPNAGHECEIECYGELPAIGDEYVIDCYGELTAIIAVIRRVVEEAGRPAVRLYQRMPQGTYPPYRRIAL
jgi:hypothetical protein